MNEAPIPFNEHKERNVFWTPDEEDKYIPKTKGFITDMIYYTRGVEVPTLFCMWSTILILAATIKREAWMDLNIIGKVYPNFYVILIGPAGVAKKNTALDIGKKIFDKMPEYIKDPNIRMMKEIKVVSNKGTVEYILEKLLPGSRGWTCKPFVNSEGSQLVDKKGKKLFYYDTSEGLVFAPELATLLGKEKYNATTTTVLTDLFDARDKYEWGVRSQGEKFLSKSLIQFAAGTTVDGFKDSVPQTAKGDGFLSRVVLVYVPNPTRIFPEPKHTKQGPTFEDLVKRLAWIAENTLGEYTFTSAAKEYWNRWYKDWKHSLLNSGKTQTIKSRMDVHLRKLAFIIKAQSYTEGREIDVQHLKDARHLLYGTLKNSPQLIDELETNRYVSCRAKLLNYIFRKKVVTRVECLRNTKLSATELDHTLNHLLTVGDIKFTEGETKMQDSYEYVEQERDNE